MDDKEFEILDVEEYRGEKNQDFSHQALVMMAMKKVIEYGCQELVPGYYNTEQDNRGKTKIVYKQDTRKAFIESVRTLRMIMICDFDADSKKKLIKTAAKEDLKPEENLLDKIETRKEFWIAEQEKWWLALSDGNRKVNTDKGNGVIKGYFNMNLPFFHNYFMEELEIYREIFEELNYLTERLKFYKKERVEA